MNRGGIRFTLALAGSLGLHAGLWWWQPVQPPRPAVSDHSMFRVSLLQPAQSTVAAGVQAAARQEFPPTEAEPPVAETSPPDPDSVADIPDAASVAAVVDSGPTGQEPPEPSESVAESSAPVQPVPAASTPPVAAPEPVTPPTHEPPPAPTIARTEPNPTSHPNRTPTAPMRSSVLQDSAKQNKADSASAASTAAAAGPEVVPARVLGNPRPAYPRQARRRGLEGQVVLEVQVLPDGHPGRIEVVDGSGHAILDQAALEALRDWRFEPAREGGRAVSATLRVPVRFQLR